MTRKQQLIGMDLLLDNCDSQRKYDTVNAALQMKREVIIDRSGDTHTITALTKKAAKWLSNNVFFEKHEDD